RPSHAVGHRDEILLRVVVQLLVDVLVGGDHRTRGKEQRVAVGRGARRLRGADAAARAAAVLDDYLLAPDLAQLLAEEARRDVGRTARGKGNDETHRLLRPGLRRRSGAEKRRD